MVNGSKVPFGCKHMAGVGVRSTLKGGIKEGALGG